MKKTVIAVAVAFALCFSLSVSAASMFTVSVDSINESAVDNETVIYTRAFGDTIPTVQEDCYVITVIPKIIGDISEETTSEESSSESTETTEDTQTTSDVTDDDVPSEISAVVSESVSEIVSSSNVAETVASSDFRYKVEKVYSPFDSKENISIPENGFVVVFKSEEDFIAQVSSEDVVTSDNENSSVATRNVTASDIEVGAPVAVYGVNFETLTVSEGAYLEIDLSGKGLLGDVPQTSDNSMTAIFIVVASLSVLSAAWICRKKCSA